MIRGGASIQCIPCSSLIISEMLPEIHSFGKFDFIKTMTQSQIIKFSVLVSAFLVCVTLLHLVS